MKKFVSLTLALVMCLGCFTPALAADSPSSWAAAEVKEAVSLGLVPAQLQSNYTAPMTRAEYCLLVTTLLEVLFDRPIDGVVAFFDKGLDVSFNDTDAPYIRAAANLEIVNGVGDGAFAPERTLIRAEAATMLSRTLELLGFSTAGSHEYADSAAIPDYAVEPIAIMRFYEVMLGDANNRITPRAPYTREAAILTILRVYQFAACLPRFEMGQHSIKITVGETRQINVAFIADSASDKTVTWQSNNTSVAEVSDSGLVTANGVGTAIITAKTNRSSLNCTVTVVDDDGVSFSVSIDKIEFWSADIETMFGASQNVCCDEQFFKYGGAENTDNVLNSVKYIHLTSGKVREWFGTSVSTSVPTWLNLDSDNPYTVEVVGPQDVVSVDEDGTVECIAFLKPGDEPRTTSIVVTSPWDGSSITIPVTVHYFPVYDVNGAEYRDAFGRELLKLCNEARKEIGVSEMIYDSNIQDVADLRAEEMAERFGHIRPNGEGYSTAFTECGHSEYLSKISGENAARSGFANYYVYSPAAVAKDAFDLWMSSTGHKANILRPSFQKMCASIYVDWVGGTGYTMAQVFAG